MHIQGQIELETATTITKHSHDYEMHWLLFHETQVCTDAKILHTIGFILRRQLISILKLLE